MYNWKSFITRWDNMAHPLTMTQYDFEYHVIYTQKKDV